MHVTNKLKTNGTTIHWHGMRQNGTNAMDGVNGQIPKSMSVHTADTDVRQALPSALLQLAILSLTALRPSSMAIRGIIGVYGL